METTLKFMARAGKEVGQGAIGSEEGPEEGLVEQCLPPRGGESILQHVIHRSPSRRYASRGTSHGASRRVEVPKENGSRVEVQEVCNDRITLSSLGIG